MIVSNIANNNICVHAYISNQRSWNLSLMFSTCLLKQPICMNIFLRRPTSCCIVLLDMLLSLYCENVPLKAICLVVEAADMIHHLCLMGKRIGLRGDAECFDKSRHRVISQLCVSCDLFSRCLQLTDHQVPWLRVLWPKGLRVSFRWACNDHFLSKIVWKANSLLWCASWTWQCN